MMPTPQCIHGRPWNRCSTCGTAKLHASRALALACLVACHAPRAPTVRLHLVEPAQWTADDRRWVNDVGSVWAKLGLAWEVTESTDRAAHVCPRDWAARGVTACTIDIGLYRRPNMRADGYVGLSDRATDESWIDAALRGYELLHVLAHEIGHQLFDTGEHPAGAAIMGRSDFTPNAVDYDLACRTIRRACR